jgi:lipopolysaccharide/colanic/teichoic acid biosynthesis glycosyltransferase
VITRPKLARQRGFVASPDRAVEGRQQLQLVARIRFQLLGGLLLAVIAPAAVRWSDVSVLTDDQHGSLQFAMIGSLVALIIGYWALRQVIAYPGVQATQYIFPTFAVAYAIVIIGFFFLRVDYSRYQFGASFLVAVVWFYACFFLGRRALRQRFGLIESGDTRRLQAIAEVDWVAMTKPAWPHQRIDGIVVDLRADLSDAWERFIAESTLKGMPVYHVKQMAEALTGKVEIEHLSENSFGSVLPSLLYLRLKRLIDLVVAIVVAPLFLAVIAVAAIAIKLDDGGPVFFIQSRIGYRGEPFEVLKLRTMTVGADRMGAKLTTDNDPRITRVGRILRKFRIDELPQFINVMAGDMSWIGPRPEAVELADWYESKVPFYAYRHVVRPGITGWAQVNQGNVAEVEAATYKLHYDFYYIKHFSPWLDVLITVKTIRTILTGFGSK